jgi:hypothetical protein
MHLNGVTSSGREIYDNVVALPLLVCSSFFHTRAPYLSVLDAKSSLLPAQIVADLYGVTCKLLCCIKV